MAERLVAEQTLSNPTGIYRLTVPNDQWRQVQPGTLYQDTDMELLNKATNEWLVVRFWPKAQITLENIVDMRQTAIEEGWNRYSKDETRQFLAGAELTPVSMAHYADLDQLDAPDSPLYVLTVGGSKHVFELIGHGNSKNTGSALELVKSFRLSEEETRL